VYISDVHRQQCWKRWVNDRKHELTSCEADTLLYFRRDMANSKVALNSYFSSRVDQDTVPYNTNVDSVNDEISELSAPMDDYKEEITAKKVFAFNEFRILLF